MAFKVLIALAIIAFTGITAQEQQCGAFQRFYDCKPCAETCGEPMRPCNRMCISGCYCEPGMVQSELGCVTRAVCQDILKARNVMPVEEEVTVIPVKEEYTIIPVKEEYTIIPVKEEYTIIPVAEPVCALNEKYYECKPCDDVCGEEHLMCNRMCTPGCACEPGMVKSEFGCISQKHCEDILKASNVMPVHKKVAAPAPVSQQCGQDEYYSNCGTTCEPVCGEKPKLFCNLMCVEGCFCKKGMLKSEIGCVSQETCDKLMRLKNLRRN